MRGNLYIVSAPSGSGKTTILQHLLRSFTDLKFSVSYTTRRPRQGEHNGTDYFFTDRATFLGLVEIGKCEIQFYRDYDYIIVNDVLENSILLLESIVRSGTVKPQRQQARIEEIIASFGGRA